MAVNLSDFVEFGNILDGEKRKLLAEYIKMTLVGDEPDRSRYREIETYTRQIDAIFSDRPVLETVVSHPEIARQVVSDIITLFRNSEREYGLSNPFASEEEDVRRWSELTSSDVFLKRDQLLSDIRKVYNEERFPLGFYERKIRDEHKALIKDKNKLSAFTESIITEWKRHLLEKETAYKLKLIDEERAEYCKKLYKQIEEFKKLKDALSPFTNELGRLWDLSSGVWQRTNLDILKRYADYLEKEESIRKLAEMLGRLDSADRELQEEERAVKVFKTEWKVEHASKSELVGVHESDDLNNLLPTELALLSEEYTEVQFLKKFADKKLMTWEYQARVLAEKEILTKKKIQVPKKVEKGPVIICVDTSGSMHGDPEIIAKTVAFAILRVALREKRPCYLISFSTTIQTLNLSDIRSSLDRLIDFLGMSFYGGTDPEPALTEALKQIKGKQYRDSDVLVISDFIMDKLSKEIVAAISDARSKKNRFHSLVLSSSANKMALESFDHNWYYDLEGSSKLRELVLDVRTATE